MVCRFSPAPTFLHTSGVFSGSNNTLMVSVLKIVVIFTHNCVAAKRGGKPVVLEEFGVPTYGMSESDLSSIFLIIDSEDKLKFYPGWVKKALDTYHG
jgi:hypothetical protein